jgi:hypothetical protein
VLQPQVVNSQQPNAHVGRRRRAGGGSWIISVAAAALVLLPEQDVAAEAAESFPSLVGTAGFACQHEDGGSSAFSGLLVGCCLVDSTLPSPSPWPLPKDSSE